MSHTAVIGGGPAGLMAAEVISAAGLAVDVYDAMPSVGRKFLMAGKGGLNLTHSEPLPAFLKRYGNAANIELLLRQFGPAELQAWASGLGVETFVGTSGRVFPKEMKAAPLLRAWVKRLREAGVRFHMRHRWQGWQNGDLLFETPQGAITVKPSASVLALGGGSWPQLGSDAAWVPVMRAADVDVRPLQPSNCGFDVAWSDHFRERFAGEPVKFVSVNTEGTSPRRGEFVITDTGIEGGAIYALSAPARENLAAKGKATVFVDLRPDRTEAALTGDLARPRGKNSLSNHLRKVVEIAGVKAGLLREFLPAADFEKPALLARAIKALPIPLIAPRPMAESISTAGGVAFTALDAHLMLRDHPGVFCAGEMLDWDAPTGGYLLTACFASGYVAGKGVAATVRKS